MMSQIKLVRDALNSIEGLTVYHYWHTKMSAPYCVWAEEGEGDSLHTGNHKSEQIITGSVDYYTKTEYDEYADLIQDALNSVENLGWYLSAVQYEDDVGLIHYTWSWQIA